MKLRGLFKKLSAFLLVLVTGLLLYLYNRSIMRDERVEWASSEINADLVTITRDYEIGWGPHGLRFWIYADHQPVNDFDRDLVVPKKKESQFIKESSVYEEGRSWGWPLRNFWNKRGFWFSPQRFEWRDGHQRWMLLVAMPFWLPLIISVSLLCGVLMSLRKGLSHRAKDGQRSGED